jgi:hypothetical protein
LWPDFPKDGNSATCCGGAIQTDTADASFFLQAPANVIESIQPAVDQFMAGLKMPAQPSAK